MEEEFEEPYALFQRCKRLGLERWGRVGIEQGCCNIFVQSEGLGTDEPVKTSF